MLDGMELAGSDQFYRYYGFYQEDKAFLSAHAPAPSRFRISLSAKSLRLVEMLAANII